MAGRHAAGQTTRRTPLIREIARFKPTKRGSKPQYRAKHALRRTRRPVAPLAAAAAITATVVTAAVGLAQATPDTPKAGELEQPTRTVDLPTGQPVLRSQTRPSPRPSSTGAGSKKVRTVVIHTAHKTRKSGTWVRVTNPRNGRSVMARVNDRGSHGSGRSHDRSQET